MQQHRRISALVAISLLVALPGLAQSAYQERPAWHLNGSAGFDFSNMHFNTEQPNVAAQDSTNNNIGGDIRVAMTGFAMDPRLLTFSADVTEIQGNNSSNSADVRTGGNSYGFVATALNGRSFPLTFFYRKSNLDYTGSGASENNDTTNGGVSWRLRDPHLPQTTVAYQWSNYNTSTPLGLSESDARNKSLRADSSEFIDGWNVGGSFGYFTGHTVTLGNLVLPQPEDTNSKNVEGHTHRGFFDNRMDLTSSIRSNWEDNQGTLGAFSDRALGYTAAVSYLHTEKLSSHYSYSYASTKVEAGVSGQTPAGAVLLLPSYSEQDLNSGVSYRPFEWLNLGQDFHAVWQSPLSEGGVSTTSYFTPVTSASVNTVWRGFQLGASGNVGFNILNSNAGDRATGTNHAEQANISWGTARYVRLTGIFSDSHQSIPLILGAFIDGRHFSLQAETDRFRGYKMTARYDFGRDETMTQAGDLTHKYQMITAQLTSRRFILSGSQSFGSGYGSVFPGQIIVNQYIYPLPTSELLFTPLLNRNNRGSSLALSVLMVRNLDFNILWGRDNNVLLALTQNYRHLDISARYRLGKMTFELGAFRYTSETHTANTALNRTNRYYLRIARDFSMF